MQRNGRPHKLLFFLFTLSIFGVGIVGTMYISKLHLVLNQYAAGSDLYVSPNGSDSNSGTQSSPFKTIQKGADSASVGTIVHVASGTYGWVQMNKSGTASSPITIISDTKWGAKIVGTGNGTTKSYLFRNNGSYVHVVGFDMSGQGVTDGLDNFGSNNLIQGNHIHDMTNINCSGTPGGSGLGDDAGGNNVYDGNVVDHIGDYPTTCDYVHGIYVDDDGDIVSNNIAYNNVGNGLYTNHGTGKVIFTNNLSFANKEYGVGINGSGNGNVVQNNILIGNSIAGLKTWSGVSGTQILNNIFFNNATNVILDGGGTQSKTITSDPKLVNYQADGSGDYHLAAGSPAIDAGNSSGAPAIDYDGHTRPQGSAIDIGPFEYGSVSGVSPTATPGISSGVTPSITQTGQNSIATSVFLHGIGKGGDNVNSNGGGNVTPAHGDRNTTIQFTNTAGNTSSPVGAIHYVSSTGNFVGNLSANIPEGQYTVRIKTDGFLSKQLPGILTVTNGAITLPVVYETTGDINNDNQLDILDYNMLISCYGSKMTSPGCTSPITASTPGADINDDGAVNGADYNLFLRELSVQSGN